MASALGQISAQFRLEQNGCFRRDWDTRGPTWPPQIVAQAERILAKIPQTSCVSRLLTRHDGCRVQFFLQSPPPPPSATRGCGDRQASGWVGAWAGAAQGRLGCRRGVMTNPWVLEIG